MQTHREYNGVDVGKMFAALLVVCIHTLVFKGCAVEDFMQVVVCNVAVPFFFIASAFFFFKRTEQDVRKFVRRLLTLYGFWFLVVSPITVLHFFVEPTTPFGENLLRLVRGFFLGSTFSGSWFLMALIIGVPLVKFLTSKIGNVATLLLGLILYVPIALGSLYYELCPTPLGEAYVWLKQQAFDPQTSFLFAIQWCCIGKILAEREHALCGGARLWFVLLILSVALGYGEVLFVEKATATIAHGTYFCLPLVVMAFFVSTLKFTPPERFVNYKRMRAFSTLFYFSHFVFVFAIVLISKYVTPVSGPLKFVIVVAVCYVFSAVVLRLQNCRGWRWLRYSH